MRTFFILLFLSLLLFIMVIMVLANELLMITPVNICYILRVVIAAEVVIIFIKSVVASHLLTVVFILELGALSKVSVLHCVLSGLKIRRVRIELFSLS